MTSLDPFRDQWAVLLTSFRRDGTPVGTPVSVAVDGERAFVRRGEDAKRAARALRRKHPVLQGIFVPLAHRLMRCGTAYFELRPDTTPG